MKQSVEMFFFRNIRSITNVAKVAPLLDSTSCNGVNFTCKTSPVQLVLKRNASIHTRNILIQKLKLEHCSNLGISLLVNVMLL